jgi:hypothetical protein
VSLQPDKPLSDVEKHHIERYNRASHAMQSGVKHTMELSPGGMDVGSMPKMLRTGINSAMVESAALAKLLVEKGIFTREEWLRAVADMMEHEAHRYEAELGEKLGGKVVLDWRNMPE